MNSSAFVREAGRYSLLVCLVLTLAPQAGHAMSRGMAMHSSHADTIECTMSIDRNPGAKPADGLIVRCTVSVDTLGTYAVSGQLYQDRRRGPIALANQRGRDMSRSAILSGHPVDVRADASGPISLELWFPGSEIRRRAHAGMAWLDIQVSHAATALPKSKEALVAHAPHWYRCRIARIDPAVFVARLPGQDVPPPLPKPTSQ